MSFQAFFKLRYKKPVENGACTLFSGIPGELSGIPGELSGIPGELSGTPRELSGTPRKLFYLPFNTSLL
jgi:hypothetical protein